MATIYHEQDTDVSALAGQKIAILGFGSQGHAHAQNLKDSGHDVRVGLREGSGSWPKAEEAGLAVRPTGEAVAEADVVMVVLPDTAHGAVYASDVAPNLKAGDMLMFAHGFSVHFGTVKPPADVDVTMIAPKGPGHLVRRTFTEGSGVPCLLAVHQDATGQASDLGLSLKMSIRTSGFAAISAMVDAGLGVAVVPESVTPIYARSYEITALRIEEPWAERRLMMCSRDPATLTPAAAAFLNHLGRHHEPALAMKTAPAARPGPTQAAGDDRYFLSTLAQKSH